MKITISQQNKKLLVTFQQGDAADNYSIDKAEDFLGVVDRFIRRSRIELRSFNKVGLEFHNTGMLTERVVRAIIKGLSF